MVWICMIFSDTKWPCKGKKYFKFAVMRTWVSFYIFTIFWAMTGRGRCRVACDAAPDHSYKILVVYLQFSILFNFFLKY